jgi:hypothetical protein
MLQLARGTTAIEAVETMLFVIYVSFLSIRFSRDLLLVRRLKLPPKPVEPLGHKASLQ